jgi:hypothetical protein
VGEHSKIVKSAKRQLRAALREAEQRFPFGYGCKVKKVWLRFKYDNSAHYQKCILLFYFIPSSKTGVGADGSPSDRSGGLHP